MGLSCYAPATLSDSVQAGACRGVAAGTVVGFRRTSVEKVAEYRFDDPDGEVGVETIVWRTPRGVLQVPFTYRAAPLAGPRQFLVGTSDHSVLGPRWVYDGSADPVWAASPPRSSPAGPRLRW